jgi:hypothetical protein
LEVGGLLREDVLAQGECIAWTESPSTHEELHTVPVEDGGPYHPMSGPEPAIFVLSLA